MTPEISFYIYFGIQSSNNLNMQVYTCTQIPKHILKFLIVRSIDNNNKILNLFNSSKNHNVQQKFWSKGKKLFQIFIQTILS